MDKFLLAEKFEEYFTTKEAAAILRVSTDTVVRKFKDEPGILRLQPSNYNGRKRVRCEIRIPASVLRRVIERHTKQSR